MIITINGEIPSKKNSRNIFCRGGRPINIPSKNYADWHEEQMWLMKKVKVKKRLDHAKIQIVIYPGTNRKADLTNKAESIMDLLVDAGILQDDNWFVCETVVLAFGGVDRANPRAEILID